MGMAKSTPGHRKRPGSESSQINGLVVNPVNSRYAAMKKLILPALLATVVLGLTYEIAWFNGEAFGRHDETHFLCDLGVAEKGWCERMYPTPPCKTK